MLCEVHTRFYSYWPPQYVLRIYYDDWEEWVEACDDLNEDPEPPCHP